MSDSSTKRLAVLGTGAIGSSIGADRSIAGSGSIKIPSRKSTMLTRSRNTHGS
jgi:ketopantoate reductase